MDFWCFTETHTPIQYDDLTTLPKEGFTWLDLTRAEVIVGVDKIKQLTGTILHERHIQDCLNPQHPSFYDGMQDYDLLIFRDLNSLPTTNLTYFDTSAVAFILFEQLLVTVHDNAAVILQIKERFQQTGRRYPNQAKILLHAMLNAIVDKFLALRLPLTQQFTEWQAKLLNENKRFCDWISFMEFKTEIGQLEILCEEKQDILDQWRQDMGGDINENFAVRLNDLANHIWRVQRFAKKIRNELDALVQLHYSVISHKTNEVVRILTVISAIFMPLTLLTGIFGMNFHYMPILANHNGYYGTLIGMGILIAVLLGIFKYKKWI